MYFNKPQQRSILTMCKEEFDVWGRGTGKTQGPLAYRTIQAANAMPRGATGLVGLTYMQLLDRTLPPLMKAWENFGYYEGLYYWVRRRPPKEYKIPDAIYPVLHPEHTIFWWNGHAFHLISQDRPGSANGKTVDAIAGDEVRFLNHKRYMDDIAPINRGNREIFGSRPEHHMVTMCTDMPTDPKAKWILDKKDLMDTKKIAQIVNFQLEVQRLEQQFYLSETTESKRYYRRKRNEYVRVLNALRANTVYYSEASSLDNLEILGVDTIKQWRREMLWPVFRAAILNENVIAVTNGFYHLLDTDHHCYSLYDYSYIESMGLYLHYFLFFVGEYFINFFDVLVGYFLNIDFQIFLHIFREIQAFNPAIGIFAFVAHSYFGFFGFGTGLFGQVPTTFFGQRRNVYDNAFAIVHRVETNIGKLYPFFYFGNHRLVPRLDGKGHPVRRAHVGHLGQGGGASVVIHHHISHHGRGSFTGPYVHQLLFKMF